MNKNVLLVVDAVSNEKGVDKEITFEAIEAALASATRKRHGDDMDFRVAVDRQTGDYSTFRRWLVLEDGAEVADRQTDRHRWNRAKDRDTFRDQVTGNLQRRGKHAQQKNTARLDNAQQHTLQKHRHHNRQPGTW